MKIKKMKNYKIIQFAILNLDDSFAIQALDLKKEEVKTKLLKRESKNLLSFTSHKSYFQENLTIIWAL